MNLKSRRSLYRWRLYGSSLRQLIPNLLPHSKVKNDQLLGVVQFYDYPVGSEKRDQIIKHMKRKKKYDFGRSRSAFAVTPSSD